MGRHLMADVGCVMADVGCMMCDEGLLCHTDLTDFTDIVWLGGAPFSQFWSNRLRFRGDRGLVRVTKILD